MQINPDAIKTLDSLMQEAYSHREKVMVYKNIKQELSDMFHKSCDKGTVVKMLIKYHAIRTVNKDESVRDRLISFLLAKRSEFNGYEQNFTVNMDTVLAKGFHWNSRSNIPSAISKSAYFMTDYKYPIFDTMAFKTIGLVVKRVGLRVPGRAGVKKFFTQYGILLNEVRKIATDKNRNFIDEMDSFLWMYGMMNGTAGTGFISRDWGNMAPAADWYYKVQQWLND